MLQWKKTTGIWAAILGLSGVILGAWAAHGLKEILAPEQVESFKTGVHYQQLHALLLLLLAFGSGNPSASLKWAFRLVLVGVLFFCGSIYLLVLAPVLGLNLGFLGPVTPLGGLSFMLAWGCLGFHFIRGHKA